MQSPQPSARSENTPPHVAQLNLLVTMVETLIAGIDPYHDGLQPHVRRVQQGALALARELGIDDSDTLLALEAAALLHDTGKMAVPAHILNKPGRLTPNEFEQMKRHAPIGAEILSSIEFPYPVAPVVRHHHENWDGTGYPDGLKGEQIPRAARILSVVDCFDALTSDRPYRRRMTDGQALRIIVERRGTMYDPAVVDAFVNAHDRIMPPKDRQVSAASAASEVRSQDCDELRRDPLPIASDGSVSDALLALASLSRALAGEARLSDVGALMWTLLRQVVPGDAMALFLPNDENDHVVVRYAAGLHSPALRGVTRQIATGIAGWSAVNRRSVLNADPALDLGFRADTSPALRSCVVTPLVENDAVIAVLAIYGQAAAAFTEDHLRLLELLAPRLGSALVESAIEDQESQTAGRGGVAPLKLVQRS